MLVKSTGPLNSLPVSWQRMNHDESLTDQDLAPELVVLTDALQLASQPGKLPLAIMTLKHRFPGALLWTPGLAGPDNLGVLASMGVDLFDLARCHEAAANGVLLTSRGPRHPLDHEETSIEAQAFHMMKSLDEVRAFLIAGQIPSLADQQSSPALDWWNIFAGTASACVNQKETLLLTALRRPSFRVFRYGTLLIPWSMIGSAS